MQLRTPKISRAVKNLLLQPNWSRSLPLLSGTPGEVVDEAFLFDTYAVRHRLLTDIANLRDDDGVMWFWKRWLRVLSLERTEDILDLRDDLRTVWERPDSTLSERTLEEWLIWTPSDTHKAIWRAMRPEFGPEAQYYMPFRCSIRGGKLLPNVLSLRAMLIQGVFEHWQHFRLCANPNCAAHYFIAKRRDQTVCDAGDCKAMRQREHALKWWNANRASSTEKTGKGRLKNGPRKAR